MFLKCNVFGVKIRSKIVFSEAPSSPDYQLFDAKHEPDIDATSDFHAGRLVLIFRKADKLQCWGQFVGLGRDIEQVYSPQSEKKDFSIFQKLYPHD